jgi:hypothetical protein
MRADIVAGAVFPDYELTDHTGYCRLVTISTDNMLATNEYRTGFGLIRPFYPIRDARFRRISTSPSTRTPSTIR